MTQQSSTFIDSTGLTKLTKWFLYLQIGISIIASISGALEYQLLNDFSNGIYTSQPLAIVAGEASDARQQVIGIIQLTIFAASFVLFLKWIYRANFNARQLGTGVFDMEFTPGWSVGWYFIPLANLWKPYEAMREIWMVSINPENWKDQTVPPLLGWWWFFWIVSSMLGNASFRLALKAEGINDLITANFVTLFSDVIEIPLSLIVLAMVSKIYEVQMNQWGKVQSVGRQ